MMCNYYTIYINLLYIYTAYGESPLEKKYSPTEHLPKNQAVLNIHSILVCFELMDDRDFMGFYTGLCPQNVSIVP